MAKVITWIFVGAALISPSTAVANHYSVPADILMAEYDSEDDCEDALAQVRNMERKSGRYEGRERGNYNKEFNARYECIVTDEGAYMIEMTS